MESLCVDLEQEVERAVTALKRHPRARRVLDGSASVDDLACYYATAYVAVEQATQLLRKSHDTTRAHGADPTLVELLARKCEEEQGHHLWLEEDLEAIGRPLGSAKSPAPGPAAAIYNDFHHRLLPECGEVFLGTAYVLESLSIRCAGAAADNLREVGRIEGIRSGSHAGVRFLASHHEADVGHVEEMGRVLADCIRDGRGQRYVRLGACFTATIYPDFFD